MLRYILLVTLLICQQTSFALGKFNDTRPFTLNLYGSWQLSEEEEDDNNPKTTTARLGDLIGHFVVRPLKSISVTHDGAFRFSENSELQTPQAWSPYTLYLTWQQSAKGHSN